MPARPRAYSYLRFSTPEQSQGDSFRRQSAMAERYAAAHGFALQDLTFQDLGVSGWSGANAETGALRAFRDAVEEGDIKPGSYLLVEALDRISRQTARKASRILEEIVEAGITLVTLADGKRWTAESLNGFDWIMAQVILFRGNEESEAKSRRLGEAWRAKRQAARDDKEILTSVAPAWLRRDGAEWAVISERAKIVRRIFREAAQGRGLQTIADGLNAEGVALFGRASHWHRSYVTKIIKSEAVLGTFQPHRVRTVKGKRVRLPEGEPVEDYFPAIVDRDVFDEARALRANVPRRPAAAVQNLFAGVLKCGRCGSTVTRTNKGEGWTYLVCTRAKAGTGCSYETWRYDAAESLFVSSGIVKRAPQGGGSAEARRELKELGAAIDDVSEQIANLVDAIARKPSAALAEKLTEREANLSEMKAKREAIEDRLAEASGALQQQRVEQLLRALAAKTIDRAKANAALRQVVSEVTVDYDARDLQVSWRIGGTARCSEGSEFAAEDKKRKRAA